MVAPEKSAAAAVYQNMLQPQSFSTSTYPFTVIHYVTGTKEVYTNKVIEWVFEQTGDQALSIPPPDLRKRFVFLKSLVGCRTSLNKQVTMPTV